MVTRRNQAMQIVPIRLANPPKQAIDANSLNKLQLQSVAREIASNVLCWISFHEFTEETMAGGGKHADLEWLATVPAGNVREAVREIMSASHPDVWQVDATDMSEDGCGGGGDDGGGDDSGGASSGGTDVAVGPGGCGPQSCSCGQGACKPS